MKNRMKKLSASKVSLIIIAVTLIAFAPSCKKSSTNTNTIFTGNYYGTLVTGFYSEADTIVITAGSTSSDVVLNTRTGRGSTYTIYGTVSGSTLNIASQQVTVASLGTTYTVHGSGGLKNTTLSISYVFVSPSLATTNLTFNGTRN